MRPHAKSIYHSLVSGIIIALLTVSPLLANDVWNGDGADDLTNNGDNWVDNGEPTIGSEGTLTFGADSSGYGVTVNAAYTDIGNIDFTGALAAYTIGETGAGDLGFDTDKIITNTVAFTHIINSSMTSDGLTFNLANNLTVGGVIDGTTITKSGVATLSLGGTNTYTGATAIGTDGTLVVTANQALGTNAAGTTVAGGGTLGISGSITYAVTEALSIRGTGVSGVGALHNISGDNSFAGDITLAAAGTIGSTTGTLTASGDIGNAGFLLTTGGAGNHTFSGVIDGGGGLTMAGTGTTTLSGINTYAGATNISAGGTLTVTANQGLGTAAAGTTVASGGTLGISGGTTYSTAEALNISGTGVSAVGALHNVSGDNTFAGAITLGAASTIGSSAGTLTASGDIGNGGFLLTTGGAGHETLSGAISGDGGLTKEGTGTLTLEGTNTYGGTTTINAGTLKVDNGAAIANTGAVVLADVASAIFDLTASETIGSLAGGGGTGGNVDLNANTLTIGGTSSTTYAGVISDSGATGKLTKAGTGTLTLSGVNTYDGLTNITAGTLTGAFTVAGDLTVADGGTLAPGSSIGTDIILGDYLLEDGGTLEVEVEKTSSGTLRNDLLDVTGTATLEAGSTINVLDITPAGRLIGTGDTFNIIEADGVITDGGPTITDNSAVLSFAGGVSGTFYQLLATRAAFATVVTGGNRSAVLRAIDSDLASASGDYVTVINALTALDSAQLNDAADQLNPLPHASATSVSTRTTQRMAGNLANYLSARRSGIESLTTLNTQSRERQLLIADASSDPRMLAQVIRKNKRIAKKQQDEMDSQIKGFFRPFGISYEHDSTSKMTGFRAKAVGAQFGFDKSFGPNLVAGIGGGYTRSFINFKQGRGESDIDSFRVGPYATYYKDNFFIDTSVSVGLHENENERNIKFGSINRTAKSDYHAWDLSGYIGGGYNFHPVKDWTLTPTTSFQYIQYRNEDFKETGAGAAGLNVDAATSQSLRGKLGVTLSTITELYKTKIVPEVFAGWAHEFIDDEDIKARFVRGTAKFTTDVDDEWDDSVYYGAGISALLKENISAFVRYEGEYSSGNDIKALHVGLTFRF